MFFRVGVGIGFVSYVLLVFGLLAVAFGFVFGAEDLHVPSVAGDVLLYSSFLDLLDLADCFEQAVFYSLLVALEAFDDCWAVEVIVDYGAELDFSFAKVVAARGVHSGVYRGVESGVGSNDGVLAAYEAGEYDSCGVESVFGVFVFSA